MSLLELLQRWNALEPETCACPNVSQAQDWANLLPANFDLRQDEWVITQKEKGYTLAINVSDPTEADIACLQRAVQIEIALKSWTFRIEYSSANNRYEAIVWEGYGVSSVASEEDPAIAILAAYVAATEAQSGGKAA